MYSFVWTDPLPLYSGRGGTESFTIGHIRELLRRAIPCRILTYGLGTQDGRENFPDIPFHSLNSLDEISQLDDTVVFLNIPRGIPTRKQSYIFFHFPPLEQHGRKEDYIRGIKNSVLMTNSRFLRSFLADYLEVKETSIHVIYPFAERHFASAVRKINTTGRTRVLYAGRLSPEKGIYTLLEALHHPVAAHRPITDEGISISVTTAGNQTIHGQVIENILRNHPWIEVTEARHNPKDMAQLFANHDIVVMPSTDKYWQEGFGMVSVEAQHAGCRVIASNAGGLPETNCGELILFEPGNSFALAKAMEKAAKIGPLSPLQRQEASKHFTLQESVDMFLETTGYVQPAFTVPEIGLATA